MLHTDSSKLRKEQRCHKMKKFKILFKKVMIMEKSLKHFLHIKKVNTE